MNCERCGSFAINHAAHGRDGSEPSLCDVCYWRQRTEQCTASNAAKDAEIASLRSTCNLFAEALDLALDGEQDHDIDPGPTGMTREQCDLVISARAAARKFLKEGK